MACSLIAERIKNIRSWNDIISLMYVLRNCKFGLTIEHGQPPASPLRHNAFVYLF